MDIEIVSQDV